MNIEVNKPPSIKKKYIITNIIYMYIHACIVCTIIPNNASWTPFPPLFPALACMTGCLPVPWKTPHPIMFVASVGLSYFGEPKFCGPCWKGFPVQNLFCCICWLVVSSLQLRPEHKKKMALSTLLVLGFQDRSSPSEFCYPNSAADQVAVWKAT